MWWTGVIRPTVWNHSGVISRGNQAPPTALMPRITRVERPSSCLRVLQPVAKRMPRAEAVKAQTDIEIDRRSIEADGIKTVGQHTVTASLHSDVSFPITVDVVAAG